MTYVIVACAEHFYNYVRRAGGSLKDYRQISRPEHALGLHPSAGVRVITYGPWWHSEEADEARRRLIEYGFNPEHVAIVDGFSPQKG